MTFEGLRWEDFKRPGKMKVELKTKLMSLFPFISWPSRPFVTEQGHLGRGPVATRQGDLVCIFPGGKTPYILRGAGKADYYLVGECCESPSFADRSILTSLSDVQGIMNGEAMGPYALREFLLR